MPKSDAADELGYIFDAPSDPDIPGSPRLTIVLQSRPTCLHFDPTEMQVDVATAEGYIDRLTLDHPWRWPTDHYRVCAGQIDINDRKNKVVTAFTFGGELQVDPQQDLTRCILTSPAPIIHLIPGTHLPTLLAVEVEVLFAVRRAQWLPHLEIFEQRLIASDPLVLYFACLKTLRQELNLFPPESQDQHLVQLDQLLQFEIDRLTRSLPPAEHPASLAKIV